MNAFDKIREQFEERLRIEEQIASNGKTLVSAGNLDGAPVVIKCLVTGNDFYSNSFRHEMRLYRAFLLDKPPFNIPAIYFVMEDPPTIILQRLNGDVVSDERFPSSDELSPACVQKTYEMLLTLRGYEFPAADDRAGVLRRYHERWEKYIQYGIYSEGDKAILQRLEETNGWREEFNHGDAVPQNIIIADEMPSLIDWEFGGSYVPLFDVAVLWAVLSRQPELQHALEMKVNELPLHDRICFAANALNVASRELRIHMNLPNGHNNKADRLEFLVPLMGKARSIIQSLA